MKNLYLLLLILIPIIVGASYVIYNQTVECNIITKEGCDRGSRQCDGGFIFSQKDCNCIVDISGCEGLDKQSCEKNSNCFSFSRGGTCSCPSCEIYLDHQCLPK